MASRKGFQRLTDAGLQGHGFNRQLEARHLGDHARHAGDRLNDLARLDRAARRMDTGDLGRRAIGRRDVEARDFCVLVNFDASFGGANAVTPSDRVVARDRTGFVVQRAHDRVTHIFGIVQLGHHLLQLVAQHELGVDAHVFVDLGAPAHGADC